MIQEECAIIKGELLYIIKIMKNVRININLETLSFEVVASERFHADYSSKKMYHTEILCPKLWHHMQEVSELYL